VLAILRHLRGVLRSRNTARTEVAASDVVLGLTINMGELWTCLGARADVSMANSYPRKNGAARAVL
jgi:hypothetical protein